VVTVSATPDPSFFQVGARLMGPAEARAELARIADASRRQVTGSARMVVRVRAAPGADYGQVGQVVQWCQELGINQVEMVR
jgi:biopolymer transport protein ExbD